MKSHQKDPKDFDHFGKVILLVRKPEEVLLAEYNRRMSEDHVGVADEEDFKSPGKSN